MTDKSVSKDKRILAAAEQVFSRKGYVASTLDEIIRIADTGKGTVYKYFGNKEQLFYTLVEEKQRPFMKKLKTVCSGTASTEEKLEKFVALLVEFLRANAVLWQVVIYEMTGCTRGWRAQRGEDFSLRIFASWGTEPTEEEKAVVEKYYRLVSQPIYVLRDIIREGEENGIFKKSIALDILCGNIYGGIAMAVFQSIDLKVSPEQFARVMVDNYFNGHRLRNN